MISAATRVPQRGSRCRLTVFSIASAVRSLAAAGRRRNCSARAAKVLAACLAAATRCLRMDAGHEIAERRGCELARLGQADVGIAAKHHADGLRLALHPAHDEEGNHAPIGNSDSQTKALPRPNGRYACLPRRV